jgi:predicted phosphodiesterase
MEYSKCEEIIDRIILKTKLKKINIILSLGNHDFDRGVEAISATLNENIDCTKTCKEIQNCYQKIAANIGQSFLRDNSFDTRGPAPFSGIINRKMVKFFVLNSGWKSSQYDEICHGKLDMVQLDWFKEKAAENKDCKEWKILLLHHHPIAYPYPIPSHDPSLLAEGSDLVEAAGKNGFNLICHGHRHHPRAHSSSHDDWKNPMTFICAGSFSVNAHHRSGGEIPNCFHILELLDREKRIIRLKTFQYRSSEGWVTSVNFSPSTPLDHDMYFSEPYNTDLRKAALLKIMKEIDMGESYELPKWEELPWELKTMPHGELNGLIDSSISLDEKRFGHYPDGVAIMRTGK